MMGLRKFSRQPLLHFLLLGLGLALLSAQPAGRPRLEISQQQLDAAAGEQGTASMLREEALLAAARARGLEQLPVVRTRMQQLALFLRASEQGDSPERRYRKALSLGLDRSDPLVRQYLLTAMREILTAELRLTEPASEQVAAYYRDHREQFSTPARLRLSHIYVGGLSAESRLRAAAIAAQLDASTPQAEAVALGGPFHGGHHLPLLSERQLAARLGADFARRAMAQASGQWSPPLASSYGYHLLWIAEKTAAASQPLSQVATRIARRLQQQALEVALARRIDTLLASYDIVLPGQDAGSSDAN